MIPTTRRATLRLTLACNNRCVFCGQEGLAAEPMDASALDPALESARATSDEVTFVGGEPTEYSGLVDAVALAKTLGFRRIGIQTNARRLANRGLSESLVRSGLTDVHVSLHGAEAVVHDYHTGVAGSFVETFAGMVAARAAGATVVVNTVLTRSNFRSLASLPRMLFSRGVAAWALSLPRVAGRTAAAFDRVPPRLGMALPFALHALESARAVGLRAWVRGAPLCMLGPFAAHALPDLPRAYGEPCEHCAARPTCPGLDGVYLARFGGDEIAARSGPVEIAKDAPELARMFVGEGEMAPLDATPGAAGRARVSLPIARS